MMRFVAKQDLAILEPDADDSQPMAKGVLQIVHAQGSKPCRTRSAELLDIAS